MTNFDQRFSYCMKCIFMFSVNDTQHKNIQLFQVFVEKLQLLAPSGISNPDADGRVVYYGMHCRQYWSEKTRLSGDLTIRRISMLAGARPSRDHQFPPRFTDRQVGLPQASLTARHAT